MVRILGSHPSDPGSSPGNGSSRVSERLLFSNFFMASFSFFQRHVFISGFVRLENLLGVDEKDCRLVQILYQFVKNLKVVRRSQSWSPWE